MDTASVSFPHPCSDGCTLRPVVCIVGPTASGKSSVAIELAQLMDAEIVSADSMQVYKGMDIGTGKVPPSERRVPHYGLDLVDPGEPYSAALFQAYARSCFADIGSRGKDAILCGGTGFYVRAAIDAYNFPKGEQQENPIREHYNAFAREQGSEALWKELERIDPRSAARIHPNNVKRVVRALELHAEGECYADLQDRLGRLEQAVPARFFGLAVDPDVLRQRIDARVDGMVRDGLVDEVRALLNAGFREGITAPQAIGYKEIVEAIDGRTTFEEALDSIKRATKRYAKRQRSWFRQDARITWLNATEADAQFLARQCLQLLHAE